MSERTARKAATSARSSVRRELRGRPNSHANRRDFEDVLRDVEMSVERRVEAALESDRPVRTDGAGVERKEFVPPEDGILSVTVAGDEPIDLVVDEGDDVEITWERRG